jgi:hypothetical protein
MKLSSFRAGGAVLAVLFLFCGSAVAGTVTIEPDDYANQADISSIHSGVTLSALHNNPTYGTPGIYSLQVPTTSVYSSTGDQVFGHFLLPSAYSPIWSNSVATTGTPATVWTFRAEFTQETNWVAIDVIELDSFDPVVMQLFDSSGGLLHTVANTTGAAGWETLSYTSTGFDIAAIELSNPNDTGDTYHLDRLRFNAPSVVPLPDAAWPGVLLLGLLGLARIYRRR